MDEGCITWCSPYNAAFPIASEGIIIMPAAIEDYSPKTAITRLTISHGVAMFTYRGTERVDR